MKFEVDSFFRHSRGNISSFVDPKTHDRTHDIYMPEFCPLGSKIENLAGNGA